MRLRAVGVFAALLLVAACSDRAADKQREEEAIARGEAPAASATGNVDTALKSCAQLGGEWQAGAGQCTLTAALCANSGAGSWHEGVGCVATNITQESDCTGFGGMQWNGSQCVLAFLDRNDFNNIGL